MIKSLVIKRFISCVFIGVSMAASVKAFSQDDSGSVKKPLLASVYSPKEDLYVIKAANVIFPEILQGNEEQASEYVASYCTKKRDYLMKMYDKGELVLPKVTAILKSESLPQELGMLMILESAFNGNAVSKAGAVGYWQFMTEVAKEYGLKCRKHMTVDERKKFVRLHGKKAAAMFKSMAKQKDERKNFGKSTAAAAHYFKDRCKELDNNWLLVVASYNCGSGNMLKAMQKTGKKDPDFWDVKKFLPGETQAYVMNFIALSVIYHNYENFVKNDMVFFPEKILIMNNFEQNKSEQFQE